MHNINESQFGFMPGRSTTDAIFIPKQTMRGITKFDTRQMALPP